MSPFKDWDAGRSLSGVERTVLEASAGTGKTWQIEGILTRLVAEEGVPIEKIVAITFTDAAAADLRHRVRRRLKKARDALWQAARVGSAKAGASAGAARTRNAEVLEFTRSKAVLAPTRAVPRTFGVSRRLRRLAANVALERRKTTAGAGARFAERRHWRRADDEVIQALAEGTDAERAARLGRLDAALANYDRAPISTIHGFCKRLLDQLAFECGAEPGREVVGTSTGVLERLVADELATAHAYATLDELGWLAWAGWNEPNLRAVAKAMTGPVAPAIDPPMPGLEAFAAARARTNARVGLRDWLEGPAGSIVLRAFRASVSSGMHAIFRLGGPPKEVPLFDNLAAWVVGRGDEGKIRTWWTITKPTPQQLASGFVGREIYERVTAVLAACDALAPQPLATFAHAVRQRHKLEIDRRAALTYDGMLSDLAERLESAALAPDGADHPLVKAVQGRYAVALVDEFQDTDGAQWGIIRALFQSGGTQLYTVGDPKQAIYSFRSADLEVYLEARDGPQGGQGPYQIRRCFRSDKPLIDALNLLWGRASNPFTTRIQYAAVQANHPVRIHGLPQVVTGGVPGAEQAGALRPRRALELRWFDSVDFGSDGSGLVTLSDAGPWLARECALECRRLLASGASIEGRPLAPGDIGVLVRTNDQAESVRVALATLRIPAVTGGRGSVFLTDAAQWLRAWLCAVATQSDADARWVALSPLGGWDLETLGGALGHDEAPLLGPDWDAFRAMLRAAGENWPKRGFARVFSETLRAVGPGATGAPGSGDEPGMAVLPRLLGSTFGERAATDLRHLMELVHAEERRTHAGPAALAEWIRGAGRGAGDEAGEAQPLRLESDARAVQIVTIHKAKGLEYPVCLIPYSVNNPFPAPGPVLARLQPGGGQVLCLPGSGAHAAAGRALELAQLEESVRLCYVATTRARHHVVAWVGATAGNAPLARLALGGVSPVPVVPAMAALSALADSSEGTIGWSRAEPAPPAWEHSASTVLRDVVVWPPKRSIHDGWMVQSYSGLAAGRGLDDGPSSRVLEERAADAVLADLDADDVLPSPLPAGPGVNEPPACALKVDLNFPGKVAWPGKPGGAKAGDWAHQILEHLDFAGPVGSVGKARDGSATDVLIADLALRAGVGKEHVGLALKLVPRWLDTPLDQPVLAGALPAGFSLRDLTVRDRLDELRFDLRAGAGTRSPSPGARPGEGGGRIQKAAALVALEEGIGGEEFGAKPWASWLVDQAHADAVLAGSGRAVLPQFSGILHGFIDLVFRAAPDTAGHMRYFVVDYKSNRSTPGPDAELRGTYTRPWLGEVMNKSAYHLQSLVYTLALHRFLRQRLGASYSYDLHVGGHLYLFLRAMDGADTARSDGAALGVYADRWPRRVILGLDAALNGLSVAQTRAAMGAGRAAR